MSRRVLASRLQDKSHLFSRLRGQLLGAAIIWMNLIMPKSADGIAEIHDQRTSSTAFGNAL
ncbi:hypothetical protein AA2016_5076 [Aminobacter aminovorans]|uniref:Uncharacterized protein n=1 Tax=Aminobacter aminovorans TaxID=83263 RepID=A0AAC8YTZ4_AMIAI|nr:hypothetical protein AA2016_5076 [Aminobacter aminovorans]